MTSVPTLNELINAGDKIETLSMFKGIATPVSHTTIVTTQP